MGKRTSPKGDATSRARSTAPDTEAPASLTKAEVAGLNALSKQHDSYPNFPVRRLVDATKDLTKSARKLEDALIEGSDLEEGALDELARRVDVLSRAELVWRAARSVRANPGLVAARTEGEDVRRETSSTLRYFLRHNPEVQEQLDEIAEGTGDRDLVDDLRKLAELIARHRPALARAKKDLGDKPVERRRALAQRIEDASSDQKYDADAAEALSLRNRAFWSTRDLEGEVREAGRHAFRNDPKQLDAFVREPYGNAGGEDEPIDAAPSRRDEEAPEDEAKLTPAPDDAANKPVEPAKKPVEAPKAPKKKSK